MADSAGRIAGLLLPWYDEHKRTMPWRGLKDPYAIWVSETMLQQTRVETVRAYFGRFMAAFPTVGVLAEAPLDEVLKLWEGLGYYRRARNLHAGACQVMKEFGGSLPGTAAELKRVRGIGDYTAGAIASIAFGERVPAVDGNVIRVTTRLHAIRENAAMPTVRRRTAALAEEAVPAGRPGDFNQAMMDLGAGICVPGTPECERCPLSGICKAFEEGGADELPVLPVRNPPKKEQHDVLVVMSRGRVLMRQRTETMLQGLWIYPMTDGRLEADELPGWCGRHLKIGARVLSCAGEARHVFTHRIWEMQLYVLETDDEEAPPGWVFVDAEGMRQLSIPTAVKAARLLAEQQMKQA